MAEGNLIVALYFYLIKKHVQNNYKTLHHHGQNKIKFMSNQFIVTYVVVAGRGQRTVKEWGLATQQARSGYNWQA